MEAQATILPPWHRSGRAYFSAMLARFRAALLVAFLLFPGVRLLPAQSGSEGPRVLVPTSRDANTAVLEAIQAMPRYGTYAASKTAFAGLTRAITIGGRGL